MKKVIASLIVTAISTIALVTAVAYFVYQGIYVEINKAHTSFPSWAFFIPAGLFGIVLAPFIVCLVNHFKTFKLIKLNNEEVSRDIISPILIGYILVIASILLVIVYLIFDGILVRRLMNFNEPVYSFTILGLTHLLFIIPITMIIILIDNKGNVR